MPAAENYHRLLLRSLVAVSAAAALTAVCYFGLDRPLAEWVHRRGFSQIALLKWWTYPPPIFQTWAPLALTLLAVRRAWGPWSRWQAALFAACAALIVADQFRQSLQGVFGRDWPATWINNNPSLLGDGAYGFHFFQGDEEFGSYPSGHMARMAGFFAVFATAYPRSRGVAGLWLVSLAVALVGMNYHFLGDVLAGTILGGVVGAWAAALSGVSQANAESWTSAPSEPRE